MRGPFAAQLTSKDDDFRNIKRLGREAGLPVMFG